MHATTASIAAAITIAAGALVAAPAATATPCVASATTDCGTPGGNMAVPQVVGGESQNGAYGPAGNTPPVGRRGLN